MSNTAVTVFDNPNAVAAFAEYAAAYDAYAHINQEVKSGPLYTSLSIKGKQFALARGGERKVIPNPLDARSPASRMTIIPIRANDKARVFFSKGFEEDTAPTAPECWTHDGIKPDAQSDAPQSTACATCQHNVFGADGKGTKCSSRIRMAVVEPSNPKEPLMLDIPPASRKAFKALVQTCANRKVPYAAVQVEIAFTDAATPQLTFTPVAVLPLAAFRTLQDHYADDPVVADIVGTPSAGTAAPVAAPAALPQASVNLDGLGAAPAPAPAPAPVTPAQEQVIAGLNSLIDAAAEPAAPPPAPAPKPRAPRAASAKAEDPPAATPTVVSGAIDMDALNSLLSGLDG